MFYSFVDFEPENPRAYLIPSAVVAGVITLDHEIWLETPGKNMQPYNETKMRRLRPTPSSHPAGRLDEYLERWDLIGARNT